VHEGDEPDVVVDPAHPDGLPGEDLTQIDLPGLEADDELRGVADPPLIRRVDNERLAR